jgi:hypothetical protein
MGSQYPSWLTILSGLLTPAIALFIAVVAWFQWTTARDKLRLDLFDRRYAVYEVARKFVQQILANGNVTHEQMNEFTWGTRTAKFVFDEDVEDYLLELWNRALHLQAFNLQMNNNRVTGEEQRRATVDKWELMNNWFLEQDKVFDDKFKPYLRLKEGPDLKALLRKRSKVKT